GCGKCCLHKLQDEDSGELFYTNVACRLLNLNTARCTRYAARVRLMPDCIQLNPGKLRQCNWLPSTCAYRLLAEGKALPDWHPLVAGNAQAVHRAGASVRGWAISEQQVRDLEDYVIAGAL
ncbi:MAG TPA: YcgN family cysteine cluster protein, partial [Candidatus Competibacteraceae bacterium]|nr:YcgN family cysteine cluster protein [Candidatus Competibacteraceae bacterium]